MTVETRYMRSDQQTVNGLLAYILGIIQSASIVETELATTLAATCYIGIRVWKRASDGTETEITAGTPVAQYSQSAGGVAMQSGTWDCPQTALVNTDAIVVRVYVKSGTGAWTLKATFTTEQLNAQSLDAATWTVWYWVGKWYDTDIGKWMWEFAFGSSTYNSRIENFTWTPPAVTSKMVVQVI